MRVYQTTKYNQFGIIEANRPINFKKVDRMRSLMKQKNLSSAYIIIVNSKEASKKRYGLDGNTYAIIDGQHRFMGLKLEGLNLYYMINDDVELSDIPKAASMQDSWKMVDYVHHYASIGYVNYKAFKGYMDSNGFPPSSTLVILCGERGRHVLRQLKHGELEIVRDWKESNEIATNISEMSEYISFSKNARFIEAYVLAYDNPEFSHKTMMTKLEFIGNKFRRCASAADFLEQIEFTYNYRTRNPIKLTK